MDMKPELNKDAIKRLLNLSAPRSLGTVYCVDDNGWVVSNIVKGVWRISTAEVKFVPDKKMVFRTNGGNWVRGHAEEIHVAIEGYGVAAKYIPGTSVDLLGGEELELDGSIAVELTIGHTPRRECDINGVVINEPSLYFSAKKAMLDLLDDLERKNVDRSDMAVILMELIKEGQYHLSFMKSRDKR
jgi:hypothetical protein